MMNPHSLEYFMEACGVVSPLQLSVERFGRPEGGRRVLQRPYTLIGRDLGSCVPLVEPQISRRHAYLQFLSGRLFCIDLGSRTGVHWEQEAKKSGWLEPGQTIRVGTYTIRYEEGGDELETPVSADWNPLLSGALDQHNLPDVILDFVNGNPRCNWEMNCAVAIMGLAPDCHIRLRGSNISSHHCSLVRTPLGVWVIDLLGRDGIRVNGEKIQCAYLNNGDRIQIGTLLIRIWHNAPLPGDRFSEEILRAEDRLALRDKKRTLSLTGHSPESDDESSALALAASDRAPSPLRGDSTQPETDSGAAAQNYALSPALNRAEWNETLLVPLVNQLAEMKKKMSDQFQQAILMVVEMFTEMHRDQANLIRQEIDRLQDLTDELHVLRASLETCPAVPALPAGLESCPTVAKNQMAEPTAAAGGVPTEVAVEKPTKNEAPQREIKPAMDLPPTPVEATQGEVHMQLFQRIEAIQQERQNQLQKILHFLTGK